MKGALVTDHIYSNTDIHYKRIYLCVFHDVSVKYHDASSC